MTRRRCKTKKRAGAGRCPVCMAKLLPGETKGILPVLGTVHGECREEVERGAELGGCELEKYCESFDRAAYPDEEAA